MYSHDSLTNLGRVHTTGSMVSTDLRVGDVGVRARTLLVSVLILRTGLFIIDGVITAPIALLGFIIMPDLPSTTKPSFLLSNEYLEISKRRMEEAGRRPPSHFTKKKVSSRTVFFYNQPFLSIRGLLLIICICNKVLGFFKTWHLWMLVPRAPYDNHNKRSDI